jgi:hypothetical protein
MLYATNNSSMNEPIEIVQISENKLREELLNNDR